MAEPVKCKKQIKRIAVLLEKYGSPLYRDVWKLGCLLGLRGGDLLGLEYENVSGLTVRVKEQKTGKYNTIDLPRAAQELITERLKTNPDDRFIFQTNSNRGGAGPLGLRSFNIKLADVAYTLDMVGKLSSHSMRKTMGFWVYKNTKDLALVCSMLNQTSIQSTLRYIGMTSEQHNEARNNLNF